MERMQDLDPVETGEWVELAARSSPPSRRCSRDLPAREAAEEAGRTGIAQPYTLNTPYVNTIPPQREERANWDRDIEHRIRSIIRWNAVAIILPADKEIVRTRRPHCELPVSGDPLRHRLRTFLARAIGQ